MTNYARLDVLNRITECGLIPIFYHPTLDSAQAIIDACVKGGATVIEFTNRGDRAWQLFSTLAENSQRSKADFILGAGSVVDAPTAALYINNGANFIVGPTFNPQIADLCNRRKVAYIPGCATLTEISNAEAAGAELVKIFPGDVLGPKFVKAVHGPQPWTKMVITGGVVPEESNIQAWFQAGATAVGLGSKLIRPDWVSAGMYYKITEIVSQTLSWIKANR